MSKYNCCQNLGEPLNGENGHDEEEGKVNVAKIIKEAINLRLPRLTADGKCEPPPLAPEEKEEKGKPVSCKESVKAYPKKLKAKVVACLSDVKATFCPCSATVAILKKYAADLVTNVGYVAGPSILAMYMASKGLDEVAISAAQVKFIVYAGLAATVLMLLKNFYTIMSMFFSIVDNIQQIVDQAIDTLKGELLKVVSRKVSNPLVAAPLALKLRGAIDEAKEQMQIVNYLPCPIRRKSYFLICFFLPVLALMLYSKKNAIMNPASTTAPPTFLIGEIGLIALPSRAQIGSFFHDRVHDASDFASSHPKLVTVATNIIMAFVASVPMIMLVLNKVMTKIETGINLFMQGKVSEIVNAPKLQEEIDNPGSCSIL